MPHISCITNSATKRNTHNSPQTHSKSDDNDTLAYSSRDNKTPRCNTPAQQLVATSIGSTRPQSCNTSLTQAVATSQVSEHAICCNTPPQETLPSMQTECHLAPSATKTCEATQNSCTNDEPSKLQQGTTPAMQQGIEPGQQLCLEIMSDLIEPLPHNDPHDPMSDKDTYQAPTPACPTAQVRALQQTHDTVKQHNKPNFMGARIPLTSHLNMERWRHLTRGYHDTTLCDQLEYGFPSGFQHDTAVLTPSHTNHQSATAYPDHVREYIETELVRGTLIGPFDEPPFGPDTQTSPILTRPKGIDTSRRRIIIDLSWPPGGSVNSFTPKDTYCGQHCKLQLPTIETLRATLETGKNQYLYSVDIRAAYRNLLCCPRAYALFNIKFDGKFYVDRALPFGARWSARNCQRVTDAITWIMSKQGHSLLNYIDDFVGWSDNLKSAQQGYEMLRQLLKDLGLPEAVEKSQPPSNKVTWLGYIIDTKANELRIPPAKLTTTIDLAKHWYQKPYCTPAHLRSLLGKLLYHSHCVPPARLFLNRILAIYRQHQNDQHICITSEFKKDLAWFIEHLATSNGIYKISPNCASPLTVICTVVSGIAAATIPDLDKGYVMQLPSDMVGKMQPSHLQALNAHAAISHWAHLLTRRNVRLICPQQQVICTLACAKGRDELLLSCARHMWALATKNKMVIKPQLPQTQDTPHLVKLQTQATEGTDNVQASDPPDLFRFKLQINL